MFKCSGRIGRQLWPIMTLTYFVLNILHVLLVIINVDSNVFKLEDEMDQTVSQLICNIKTCSCTVCMCKLQLKYVQNIFIFNFHKRKILHRFFYYLTMNKEWEKFGSRKCFSLQAISDFRLKGYILRYTFMFQYSILMTSKYGP